MNRSRILAPLLGLYAGFDFLRTRLGLLALALLCVQAAQAVQAVQAVQAQIPSASPEGESTQQPTVQSAASAPVTALSLAEERQQIARRKAEIEARYDSEKKACWQRFAVNDCLRRARLERRAAITPLQEREWVVLQVERDAREQVRRTRLEGKQTAAGVSASPPLSSPAAPSPVGR